MRVALATCLKLPEPDPDQGPLLEALRARGLRAEMLAWDGPQTDPAGFDVCVIRSTWNYPQRPEPFAAWLRRAANSTRLINPWSVVRWNLHKSYLGDLARRGIPVIPTRMISRGAPSRVDDLVSDQGWRELVIKPCISAASFQTRKFRADQLDDARAFLEQQLSVRDMLVQRYMPSVETLGERSLVWIDGQFTHAVRKAPRYAGAHECISQAEALTDQDRAFGDQAIRCVEGELLYARVDMIYDDDGRPCLSELELIEPSLFLLQHPPALERFADAIARLAHETRP